MESGRFKILIVKEAIFNRQIKDIENALFDVFTMVKTCLHEKFYALYIVRTRPQIASTGLKKLNYFRTDPDWHK